MDQAKSRNLPEIPVNASLQEWQAYVQSVVSARGWNKASDLEVFLLFSEEVGEFAKAFRRYRKLFSERVSEDRFAEPDSIDVGGPKQEMADELADILSYLLDLANRLEIDLETAFRDKELKNQSRDWV